MLRWIVYLMTGFLVVAALSNLHPLEPVQSIPQHIGLTLGLRDYESDDYAQSWRVTRNDGPRTSITSCSFSHDDYSHFTFWGENRRFAISINSIPLDIGYTLWGNIEPGTLFTNSNSISSVHAGGGICVLNSYGRIFVPVIKGEHAEQQAMLIGSDPLGDYFSVPQWRTWNLYPIEGKTFQQENPSFLYSIVWLLRRLNLPQILFLQFILLAQVFRLVFQPGERFAPYRLAGLSITITFLMCILMNAILCQIGQTSALLSELLFIPVNIGASAATCAWISQKRQFSSGFRLRLTIAGAVAGLLMPLTINGCSRVWLVVGIILYTCLVFRYLLLRELEKSGVVADEIELLQMMAGLIRRLAELIVILIVINWSASHLFFWNGRWLTHFNIIIMTVVIGLIWLRGRSWIVASRRRGGQGRKKKIASKEGSEAEISASTMFSLPYQHIVLWFCGAAGIVLALLAFEALINAIIGQLFPVIF